MIFHNPQGAPELACDECGCRWFDRINNACYECGAAVKTESVEEFRQALTEHYQRCRAKGLGIDLLDEGDDARFAHRGDRTS